MPVLLRQGRGDAPTVVFLNERLGIEKIHLRRTAGHK
jgi:hypothetical protein